MGVYDQPKDDPGALGRELSRLRRGIDAGTRRSPRDVPDPTPPPDDVSPGTLTRALLEGPTS